MKGGGFMEQQIASYIQRHTIQMTILIVAGFVLLGAGQYYLYRQQMHLNNMVSEGLMQIKEAQNIEDSEMIYDDAMEESGNAPGEGQREDIVN